jgi:hypothetical protein
MGYGIAVIFFVIGLLAVFFAMRRSPSSVGQGRLPSDHPVTHDEPAADEPTPGASDTHGSATIERASRRVPPA